MPRRERKVHRRVPPLQARGATRPYSNPNPNPSATPPSARCYIHIHIHIHICIHIHISLPRYTPSASSTPLPCYTPSPCHTPHRATPLTVLHPLPQLFASRALDLGAVLLHVKTFPSYHPYAWPCGRRLAAQRRRPNSSSSFETLRQRQIKLRAASRLGQPRPTSANLGRQAQAGSGEPATGALLSTERPHRTEATGDTLI